MAKKVLIIDDAGALRYVLSYDLGRQGYDTITAPSGEKGIEAALTRKPDLILLDIVLGKGIDGFEVLSRLKQSDETKSVPVLMTTARSAKEDVRKSMELGAAGFIIKPFGFGELIAKIKQLIG